MTQNLEIIAANPSGNKTIFVTTPVARHSYQQVASFLLSLEEYEAEQVAFILPDGSMEMSGLEFCGNASRTFALIKAQQMGLTGRHTINIKVSGSNTPLQVEIDTDTMITKINMPLPVSIIDYNGDILVDLGGILHLVTTSRNADPNVFQRLKQKVMSEFNTPAMGVMFYSPETSELIPVVYVADVDTTYFEGSCASGTTATAAAMSLDLSDGEYSFIIRQPKGELTATIKKRQNVIESVSIEGPVIISNPTTVPLPPELKI